MDFKEKINNDLVKGGKTFQVIKYRILGFEQFLKYEAQDQIGDIYKECKDGWFKNIRNNVSTNILNIKNRKKYYKEVCPDCDFINLKTCSEHFMEDF